jgi:MFS family permease
MSGRLKDKILQNDNEDISIINPEEEKLKESYKKLLLDIGMEGKYQKYLFALFCMAAFLCCLLLTSFPLQKDLPEHYCLNRIEFEDDLEDKYSEFKKNTKKYKIIKNEQCIEQMCFKKEEEGEGIESHNKLIINHEHQNSSPSSTILVIDKKSVINFVTELDVICHMESFFSTMTQMLFLGRILGNFVFSYISDKYGRLVCFKIQFYTIVMCYLTFYFIRIDLIYIIVSLLVSCCVNVYNLVSAMSTEIMSQKMYSLLNGLLGASFTMTGLLCIFVFCFFKNWNILIYIHFIVTAFVMYAVYTDFLTESPIFLLDQGNYSHLNKVITHIATVNDTLESANVEYRIQELREFRNLNKIKSRTDGFFTPVRTPRKVSDAISNSSTYKPESFLESLFGPYLIAFKSQETTTQFFKQLFIYLTMHFVFFGQVLNVEKMNGNIYYNSFIIYLAEIISEISAGYFLQKYGRRQMVIWCFGLSAVFCLILNIIERTGGFRFLFTIFIFANSFFISITFVVVYVYSAEIFDSNVKSTMNSLLVNLSNVFLLASPYLISQFASPFALFCMLSLGACLNGFILKETKED